MFAVVKETGTTGILYDAAQRGMAKNQYLTKYQQGIVNRFYEHRDARVVQRLQELVSEIYLATGENALKKKWDVVAKELEKTNAGAAVVARIVTARDIKALAALLSDPKLSAEQPRPAKPPVERDDV